MVKKKVLIGPLLILLTVAFTTPARAGLGPIFGSLFGPSKKETTNNLNEQYLEKLKGCEEAYQKAEKEIKQASNYDANREAEKTREDCLAKCPSSETVTDIPSFNKAVSCRNSCPAAPPLDLEAEMYLSFIETDYKDCVAETREWYLKAGGKLSDEEMKQLEEYRKEEQEFEESEQLLDQEVEPEVEQQEKEDIRELKVVDFEGKPVEDVKAKINYRGGKEEVIEVKDGKISYDFSKLWKIFIFDPNNKQSQLLIPGKLVPEEKIIMAKKEDWFSHLLEKGKEYAKILNDGQDVNLEEIFKFYPDAKKNEFKSPYWLKYVGFKKCKVYFNAEEMARTGDISNGAHEFLGHGLIEKVGQGNEYDYAEAGEHNFVWEPAYKKRFFLVRWLTQKKYKPLSDEAARGMGLVEGWPQYVSDKWNRQLNGTPDDKSELTLANAKKEMAIAKTKGEVGRLYADQPGYGAKVENVVATFFNELYKNKSLKETVEDFTKTRKAWKDTHGGKTFQNINEFIDQKLKMIKDEKERERINHLVKELSLEVAPSKQPKYPND